MLIDVVRDVEGVRSLWHNHIGRADSVQTVSDEPNSLMAQRKTFTLWWLLFVFLLLNSPSRSPSRSIPTRFISSRKGNDMKMKRPRVQLPLDSELLFYIHTLGAPRSCSFFTTTQAKLVANPLFQTVAQRTRSSSLSNYPLCVLEWSVSHQVGMP